MQITVNQSDLNSYLSLVSRAIPSRPNHPVLANVLLKANEENQKVELTGFDLNLGIRASFDAAVESEGSLTLPAKLFGDIVSRLPDGEITISSGEEAIATISSSSGKYEVRGMAAEEYPDMPTIVDGKTVRLSSESFVNGLKGTLFATSGDETKQVLTGVHLKIQPDALEFAATDGHRLAVVVAEKDEEDTEDEDTEDEDTEDEDTENGEKGFEITIPAKAFREIEKAIAKEEFVSILFDDEQILCELGNVTITARVLDGSYPNYESLLPKKFTKRITVNRKSFLQSAERIAVLADQKNNILKCDINSKKQEIALSVDAKDVGSGRETLNAQIAADESVVIGFNVKYLVEGLKAVPSASEVQFQLNEPTSVVVLTSLGGIKMTYLIMPVQLRN